MKKLKDINKYTWRCQFCWVKLGVIKTRGRLNPRFPITVPDEYYCLNCTQKDVKNNKKEEQENE